MVIKVFNLQARCILILDRQLKVDFVVPIAKFLLSLGA